MYAMITGTIRKVETKTSQRQTKYISIQLHVNVGSDRLLWNIRVFSESSQQELAGATEGDVATFVGRMEAGIWRPEDGREPRVSLSMIAEKATVLRKPEQRGSKKKAGSTPSAPRSEVVDPFDDGVPF